MGNASTDKLRDTSRVLPQPRLQGFMRANGLHAGGSPNNPKQLILDSPGPGRLRQVPSDEYPDYQKQKRAHMMIPPGVANSSCTSPCKVTSQGTSD